jgi:hypothetical protein
VRLLLAGKDQGPFGPDGVAVTRAFVVPPAPRSTALMPYFAFVAVQLLPRIVLPSTLPV